MKKTIGAAVICLIFGISGAAWGETQALPGPTLIHDLSWWGSTGLSITPVQDVVLERFTYRNQGQSDTIVLEDSAGSVIEEYAYAGGDPAHVVKVKWQLYEGASYHIMARNPVNGRWANYSSFPESNDHLQVNGIMSDGILYTRWWFNFTNLETAGGDQILTVGIDVKPGSSANSVNLKSKGKIPVAILSDEAFDATSVDPWSIEMAGAAVAARKKGKRLMAREADVNEDGLPDLLVHFRTPDLAPELLVDGWAELTAVTFEGTGIEGVDHVRLVPKKRRR